MRSAPPLTIGVTRFGVLRALVGLLAGGACASLFLWWRAQPMPTLPGVDAVAGLGSLATAAIALTIARMPPMTLHWDRQRWRLARDGVAEVPGEIAVAIDLGNWLLLRFVADAGPAWRKHLPTWIALQRHGLEGPWHAIRCALYSARAGLPPEDVPMPTLRQGG